MSKNLFSVLWFDHNADAVVRQASASEPRSPTNKLVMFMVVTVNSVF